MRKYLVAMALLIGLVGCKMGKNYKGVDVNVPESYMVGANAQPNDSKVNSDSITLDSTGIKWYDLFNDPVLDSLVKAGLTYNQDLRIAAKNVEIAGYAFRIQRADMLPTFGVDAGAGRGNFQGVLLPDEQNLFYGVGTVNWEIDFWGKYRRLNEVAKADLIGSQEGYRSAQLLLVSSIANTYFTLLEYEERLAISKQTLALRDSTLYIIEARFEKGIIPEIDLNQAQIQQAIAASSIPVIKRKIAQVEHLLNTLTGTNPKRIVLQTDMLKYDTAVVIPEGLPADLLARRPDIRAAEQQLIAQNALVGVAQANRLPSISLTGLLGVASNDLSNLTSGGLAWNLTGGLVSPLFNWGKNVRKVDVEKAKREQAILNYESVVLNAFREVEDLLVTIETLKEELIARNNHVNAALNAQNLSQQRYDKGVTSYLEYLESQRQAFEAQQNYVATKQKLLSAYANLYKALGGGWDL